MKSKNYITSKLFIKLSDTDFDNIDKFKKYWFNKYKNRLFEKCELIESGLKITKYCENGMIIQIVEIK